MKYRPKNSDSIYTNNSSFTLCWNSEKIGTKYSEFVIRRLLNTYDNWVADYDKYKDNNRIKNFIKAEIDSAKQEVDQIKSLGVMGNINFKDCEEFGSENEESGESNNSFVISNSRVRRVYKIRLGRRTEKKDI